MTSRSEVQKSFEAALKAVACPNCDERYTDAAVTWCNGWIEGRQDLLQEIRGQERDGQVCICCELCGAKSSINIFTWAATLNSTDVNDASS